MNMTAQIIRLADYRRAKQATQWPWLLMFNPFALMWLEMLGGKEAGK